MGEGLLCCYVEYWSYLIPTSLFFFSCQILFLLFTELYKMVCEPDETDLNIHIPAVMLPLDAGTRLENMLMSTSSGELPLSIFIIVCCLLGIFCGFAIISI